MDGDRVRGAEPAASGVSKEEAAMDTYLRSKGLYRKKIAKDGSCLFRAVAEQVLHSQARHLEVRKSCIKYLRENRALFEAFIEGSFDEHLKRLENPQEWVGQVEISALSLMFKKEFVIYQEPDVAPARVTDNGFSGEIMLCFSNGNHYDIIYPSGFAEKAALCQSIIYELLYEKVFGVNVTKHMFKTEALDWKGEEEVHDSDASGSDGDDDAAGCRDNVNFAGMNGFKSHKDGKPPQIKEGHSVVPAAALRSLNPTVFRNVEYEVWMKAQRDQQRLDFSIAAGLQYSVGDKCKVRLEHGGALYNAHIQDVAESGPAVVFVEELGEKKVVPLKHLKPAQLTVGNNDGWSTVAGKKIKKPSVSGTVVQFEKDNRGQKSLVKPHKTQSVPSPRLQQASGIKQHGLPADQTSLSESKGQSKASKVPGRKLDRERGDESSFYKRENVHFGLTPEERREKQVIEESKSLYEMQNRDTDAFPTLSASIVDAAASGSETKKNPTVNREKSARRKSEDDPRAKASKLAQPARVDDQKTSEETKPPATSDEAVVMPNVTVLPTPAEQQTPTTVPSQPPVVTPWSGISAPVSTCAETTSDSAVLEPQVTSTFSPLPASMPAVSQHLLPMPQALSPYQDPLYPGFPVNEKGERITSPPPYSYCKNGSDLPSDKCILHFFYNLGVKAYTCPMWPPHLYLHPLHQAYLNVCRIYPNIPVYPQNSWMQDVTVNPNDADPSLLVPQNEVRYDDQCSQPATLCSSAPLTPSVQVPEIAGHLSSQANELEDKLHFQPMVGDCEGTQASKAIFPQPHFGQGSYMGHLPVAPQVFSQVWYGYPYQGYIENPVVQHNVYIPPQSRNVPASTLSVDVAECSSVEGTIKQHQELMHESRPDMPLFINVAAVEELVKPGQQIHLDSPEMVDQKSLIEKVPESRVLPSVVTKTSEEQRSTDQVRQLTTETASVNPPEDRPLRAKEESSEDEREICNILSGGRSKNFYNQSYGNRRFRNEKFHQPNRGGYQYSRNEEAWRGARGREDGYPHYRSYRGRPNRRRPMGEPYRQYHE
ncbi:PREDICTED: OTU domain-containing protein 4 [Nanorana parkeri]|uniref:OTU domain-containing protein 4 n=1 Tax=Nanorana parkeri TaxID=125878 RepID=UPI000854AC1A|nr:PREDICTED: OTU domain-containing protein 4 [Nanorana parkeri]